MFVSLTPKLTLSAVPFKLDVQPDSEGQDKKHYLTITCKLDASLTSMEKVTALTLYGPRPYGAVDRMDPLASVDLWTPQPQLVHNFCRGRVPDKGTR
ncbi:hypothetical protein PoB_001593300 [Plakobranchus ocellatus]|uniref:C2 domain-containing protein n=1 Tax=Plakobranchus ocellatus TaxID=259542 RepID=A0AAV3Z465_9GAST|nr:hypothetical protein PoB_001593300 [Plakobranchus ocellatus]